MQWRGQDMTFCYSRYFQLIFLQEKDKLADPRGKVLSCLTSVDDNNVVARKLHVVSISTFLKCFHSTTRGCASLSSHVARNTCHSTSRSRKEGGNDVTFQNPLQGGMFTVEKSDSRKIRWAISEAESKLRDNRSF